VLNSLSDQSSISTFSVYFLKPRCNAGFVLLDPGVWYGSYAAAVNVTAFRAETEHLLDFLTCHCPNATTFVQVRDLFDGFYASS
jgi:hypothetical protein